LWAATSQRRASAAETASGALRRGWPMACLGFGQELGAQLTRQRQAEG